ncbi:MAG TPA: glucose-1-phosphate thymidylyltransferase, partial [Anaerolineae bacterium]|nr:glucose-1-phosphate thymidylyltransferase [Anaerolineae bacterium]
MKVVILAAEEQEAGRPKALIRLCGIPLARRLLHTLRAADLRDVIVVTGPDGRAVREALGDGADLGMRL